MAASVAVSSESRLGEVIETSTSEFWAESVRLNDHPPFGSIVSADMPDGSTTYGVVSFGQTGGLDPTRRAVRRGDDHLSDDAIYQRHPQLELVLRTTFRVTSVGYSSAGRIRHILPPSPVPLHYSVVACDRDTVTEFTRLPAYFPALLRNHGDITGEDLVAAHLIWTDRLLNDNHIWLSIAVRQIASLLKRDYDRLTVILNSVDPDPSIHF